MINNIILVNIHMLTLKICLPACEHVTPVSVDIEHLISIYDNFDIIYFLLMILDD